MSNSQNSARRAHNVLGAIFILLAVVVILAACGGTAPTATPTVTATRQGTLRVAVQPIAQTDPAFISSDAEVLIANQVYDYLVDVDPTNQIVPRLAVDWSRSEDGLTYAFRLAEGVTFHNGSPFTAEDVVWTYNRLRDPQLGLPTQDLYSNIESITATGPLEVTFTLKETNPFFLYDLSDNHALILKANTADPTNFNGTGPFVVTNYVAADRIVMAANENYFVKGQPYLEGLEIIFFSDETAGIDALRGGQIDMTTQLSIPLYQSLRNNPNLTTVTVSTNQFDLIRLRVDREPGNNPKVIQALKLATDREALFQLVQQSLGAVGRDSPIGPMYEQYYSEETPIPARDPEMARQLLSEAGYPNGLSLQLYYPNVLNHSALASALKAQWEPAGIRVDLVGEPESVYYGEGKWLEVDLGITGWGSRPYPQFYLDVMLVCGAKWNEAHWCDQEFDQLAMKASTTLDEQVRVQAYKDIQRVLIERGPIIVPYFWARFAAISNRFEGLALNPFVGRTRLSVIRLAQ